MTAPIPTPADLTPADLALFRGGQVDDERAQFFLDLAMQVCEAYASPLPDTAAAVVLAVADRAYMVPTDTFSYETAGSFSRNVRGGGLRLTREDKRALDRAAGRGGAFTINPTPVDAGADLPPWDANIAWPESYESDELDPYGGYR
jgi:hypothetical protein